MSGRPSASPASGSTIAVAGVMLVIFLFAIDATIVSSVMPTAVANLGGLELYSWVFSIYMLASALSMPLFGKLSDLFSRRRLILVGIGVFMLGSALCGAAESMVQLIVFRAIQGAGGGAIYALSFIIVGVVFPPEKRGKMQGLISSVWGVAGVLGPLAGGLIAQYWNWRWIFFVNLPSGFLAAAFIILGFHEGKLEFRRPRLDLKGAVTLLLGLLTLFYALLRISEPGESSNPVLLGLFAFASAAFLLFLVFERLAVEPLLPLGLFRLRLFSVSTLLSMLASMGIFGLVGYLPLYVQGVLGATASRSGTALLVVSLGWTVGSITSGQGMNRFGYRTLCVTGMVLMTLGYGLFISAGVEIGIGTALADSALIGVGMGMVNVTSLVAAQSGAPRHQIGVATSTIMLFRTFGGALGVSIIGTVLFRHMHDQLLGLSVQSGKSFSPTLIEKLANPQDLLRPSTRALIPDHLLPYLTGVLADSLWYAFLVGLLIVGVGLGLSLFMADLTPATTPRVGESNQTQS